MKWFTIVVMGYIVYIIAGILIVLWAVEFFAYNASALVHLLLVVAAILIILKMKEE